MHSSKKYIIFAIETVSSELTVSIANKKNRIMRFYDREKEIRQLHEISTQSLENAQFTVITGRRRIGKTQLLLKAGETSTTLYFFVSRKAEPLLLCIEN